MPRANVKLAPQALGLWHKPGEVSGGDTCSDPVLSGVKMDQRQGSAQIVLHFSHNCSVNFGPLLLLWSHMKRNSCLGQEERDALVPFLFFLDPKPYKITVENEKREKMQTKGRVK